MYVTCFGERVSKLVPDQCQHTDSFIQIKDYERQRKRAFVSFQFCRTNTPHNCCQTSRDDFDVPF